MGDGCRFQPLIFQDVITVVAEKLDFQDSPKYVYYSLTVIYIYTHTLLHDSNFGGLLKEIIVQRAGRCAVCTNQTLHVIVFRYYIGMFSRPVTTQKRRLLGIPFKTFMNPSSDWHSGWASAAICTYSFLITVDGSEILHQLIW